VEERFLESLLKDVFGVFANPCVAEREPKNPSLVAVEERFKRLFISTLGGGDEFFLRS
jgi:hypothetical protein